MLLFVMFLIIGFELELMHGIYLFILIYMGASLILKQVLDILISRQMNKLIKKVIK